MVYEASKYEMSTKVRTKFGPLRARCVTANVDAPSERKELSLFRLRAYNVATPLSSQLAMWLRYICHWIFEDFVSRLPTQTTLTSG